MDNLSKFRYFVVLIKTLRMDKMGISSYDRASGRSPSNKIGEVGKSASRPKQFGLDYGCKSIIYTIELRVSNWKVFCFQEKIRKGKQCKPYRKPTQVGELSIHRRSRELSLRNSAIKLDVSLQDVLPPQGGHSKRFLSDCLTKTQLPAKAKADV